MRLTRYPEKWFYLVISNEIVNQIVLIKSMISRQQRGMRSLAAFITNPT